MKALIATVALVALLTALAAPAAPHDHVGKPGSVCPVCSTVQAPAMVMDTAAPAPGEQALGTVVEEQQYTPSPSSRSLRIPRAPPA